LSVAAAVAAVDDNTVPVPVVVTVNVVTAENVYVNPSRIAEVSSSRQIGDASLIVVCVIATLPPTVIPSGAVNVHSCVCSAELP
jgi:hypothetical protein